MENPLSWRDECPSCCSCPFLSFRVSHLEQHWHCRLCRTSTHNSSVITPSSAFREECCDEWKVVSVHAVIRIPIHNLCYMQLLNVTRKYFQLQMVLQVSDRADRLADSRAEARPTGSLFSYFPASKSYIVSSAQFDMPTTSCMNPFLLLWTADFWLRHIRSEIAGRHSQSRTIETGDIQHIRSKEPRGATTILVEATPVKVFESNLNLHTRYLPSLPHRMNWINNNHRDCADVADEAYV